MAFVSTEPEDAEPFEPKVEEQNYQLSHSSHSPTTPTTNDNPFAANVYLSSEAPSYTHSHSHRTIVDRWSSSGASDISRVATPTRTDYTPGWQLSPITSPASISGSLRREPVSGDATWSPAQRYESSSSSPTGLYGERSRRNVGPYHGHAASRDSSDAYGSSRQSGTRHRDGGAHRLPWLLNETNSVDAREARGNYRSSYNQPSATVQNTFPTVPQYSSTYGPAWGGSTESSPLNTSSSAPFNQHGYSSHATAFASQTAHAYES